MSEKLTDPVEDGKVKKDNDLQALDMSNAALSFKPIPPERARITRPFDGYPIGSRKVTIGTYKNKKGKAQDLVIPSTYIVALNPTVPVYQDPSNKKVKTKEGMVQIKTVHARVIRDRELNENIHVPFDREMTIGEQTYQYAVVSAHNVRAQICFKYDTTKKVPKIEVDRRYLLLDSEQISRLKQVFEQVINPRLRMEREAAFITGESETDTGGVEPITE
ncbi:MAG: hypothetical protein D4R45_05670 [Planctomycetaceae bacterium]|nr:MAG: hypothetical protein D4R45_05670 [Planctomycetaceae bacterium]